MGKGINIFHEIEEKENIIVGIIGGGSIGEKVKEKLEEKGCQVIFKRILSPLFYNADYIFIFEKGLDVKDIRKHLRHRKSKFLLVSERYRDIDKNRLGQVLGEDIEKSKNVRLIFIGDIRMWDEEKLGQTLLWAMFAKLQDSPTLDFAKEGVEEERKREVKKVNIKFPRINILWVRSFLISVLILSPILFVLFNFFSLYGSLKNFQDYLFRGDLEGAKLYLRKSEGDLRVNNFFLNSLSVVLGPLGESTLGDWKKINTAANKTLETGEDGLMAIEMFQSYKDRIGDETLAVKDEDIKRIGQLMIKTKKNFIEMRENISRVNLAFFPKETLLSQINRGGEYIQTLEKFMPFMEKLFDGGSYKFLILFQNNMELRPTGGFIGSYAILNIERGRVTDFKIHDVYDADGKLLAHVEPPLPIREYMSQPNWFLRDSNFDPDFMLSAQQAEWFLEKELSEKFDVVMGVNFNVLKEILKITGPVYLPDYREYITADNVFIKATTYIQKGFFPGSTAKGDFLGSVGKAIFNVIIQREVSMLNLLPVINERLDEKDILIYFHDEILQNKIEEYGWGGRIIDLECNVNYCLADYLAIIEANLGVNKANLYVQKKVELVKKFLDGSDIETRIKIVYTNSSPSEVFPSGSYKNYNRIYVPRGVVISEARIDGKEVERLDIRDYEKDKSEVGMWVVVGPQKKVEVDIAYTQASGFSPEYKVYQFFYQKQPGENVSSINVDFDFPKNWKVKPRNFSFENNKFIYITDSAYDRVFMLDVER